MIWFSLIIPLIGAGIAVYLYRSRIVWWELLIPAIACVVLIGLSDIIFDKVGTSDVEYISDLGVRARYYEPYQTYVHRTCYRSVSCGKNCTTQVPYDCSYCDDNGPRWVIYDSRGNEYSISKKTYDELTTRWKSKPKFIELGRNITYALGCGRDGDAYEIYWNGDPTTSEVVTNSHLYENRLQAAHTSFDFMDVDTTDIKAYGLFDYPEINGHTMRSVLGSDQVTWMKPQVRKELECYVSYVSGRYGAKTKGKVFLLIFVDKPSIAANYQEAYWKGGNENEAVVCIGLSKSDDKIRWVNVFSWTDDKRLAVDIREDISSSGVFDHKNIFLSLDKRMSTFKYKDFKEFSYVKVDPPLWYVILVYVLVGMVTFGVCYWSVHNEYHHENDRYDYFNRRKW